MQFFLESTFLFATSVQVIFWLFLFSKLAFYKKTLNQSPESYPGLSIIICARNAAEDLQRFLPKILQQNYPNFEVIVVNDQSSDNSTQIILDLQKKYPTLHLIEEREKLQPGKKGALSKGILAANFELLLLTDADCFPNSNFWIDSFASVFSEKTAIVLGFSPYQKRENSFLNLFIRFETIYTATQYFSFALAGMPYMGVGRNLAYTKSLFKEHQGFKDHLHIASGDDDLFISQAANKGNTIINIDPEAFVYSVPKSSWKSYYYQKRRHLTTASHYSKSTQWLLIFLAWSHWWHYLGALILVIAIPSSLPLIGISYLVRIGIVSFQYWRILGKLNDPGLRFWIPILDASYFLFYCLFAPALIATGSNKKSWT